MPTAFKLFAMPLLAKAIRATTVNSRDLPAGYDFNPRELFSESEQGIWLDPYDMSTMFQDAAGTTPVTALGQPVGLALDKRLGLALGPELLTNGDFSAGATGWSLAGEDATHILTFSNGTMRYQSGATTPVLSITQNNILAAGKSYQITAVCSQHTSGSVKMGEVAGGSGVLVVTGVGTFTAIITYTGLGSFQVLRNSANVDLTLDSLSIKEVKGNHAYQTTAASRPTLEARVNLLTKSEVFSDASSWAKTRTTVTAGAIAGPLGALADKVYEDTSTNTHYIAQALSAAPNTVFTASIYVKAAGRTRATWYMSDSATGPTEANINLANGTVTSTGYGSWTERSASITNVGDGWFRVTVSGVKGAGTTVTSILLLSDDTGNLGYTGDGVSGMYVTAAQLEYSPVATTYQKVNTATDYVDVGAPRYLQHDGIDDGMVTASINFTSTDKVTLWAGVRKLSDAATGTVVELSAAVGVNTGTFGVYAPLTALANYAFGSRGTSAGTSSAITTDIYASPNTSVLTAIGDISGDVSSIRVNGATITTVTTDQGTGNYGNYPLYIGRRGGTTLPFNGRLYGLIVRGAASNAGQIAATEAYVNAKTRAY